MQGSLLLRLLILLVVANGTAVAASLGVAFARPLDGGALFVDGHEIKAAFEPYYETTLLSEATDPNLLYEIQTRLARATATPRS
jgi:hypothetical protein